MIKFTENGNQTIIRKNTYRFAHMDRTLGKALHENRRNFLEDKFAQ